MFWGLILKANKKYSQTLKSSFHLSQASLDESASTDEPVQVMYIQDENAYLLCTLQKNKIKQCSLDLNFSEGNKVCFSTKGNGIVHLTGYLIPDEFDMGDDDLGEEEEEEDEEVEEEVKDLRNLLKEKKKDKKAEKAGKKEKNGKPKVEVANEDSDSDEDDEDFEEGDVEEESSSEEADTTMEGAEEKDSDDDDDDDDDEDGEEEEDSDEDEDDSDEEVQEPKPKQQKLDKEKDNKKKPQQNGLQNGHKEAGKKDKKEKENKEQKNKTQTLQGGLQVQDLKVGGGAEAKPGKKVCVYYEGRLKSNNKMFDSTKQGPGFKFVLGRNEVIRGWDLGVAGMKVGGKRRLTIPAALAYGAKGSPPVIPPNSPLVFDVELKNVLN